jgi:hypothetical protein
MVLRLPRPEKPKKKSVKTAASHRPIEKSDYKNSLGASGPIPYAHLIGSA